MNIGFIPQKWARLTPENQAVIDASKDQRINYGDFDCLIRKLANALLSLGLRKGDRVAILSQNAIENLATFYACGRVGLIAQPMNWRLSITELLKIIENGSPKALISEDAFSQERTALMNSQTSINHWFEFGENSDGSFKELIADSSQDEPEESQFIGDDDPLFILYTGGTTGESKGALHSHKSVWYGMLNQTVAERIVPSDVYMLTGQMFHIPVVLAMNYQAHGCPLVLMNFEPELALELISKEKVSAFLGVTTMLNWMMAVDNFEEYDLSSLRNIQYGGGPMPSRVIAEALEAFPCTLIQGYGQTEGTTMTFLSQEDHIRAIQDRYRTERLRSCGREGFVTQIKIVNSQGNTVPKDGKTPGEIIVKSPANMLGYFQRPDLTEETIRDGWMWTGDIATWDEEGYCFIVDRAKDMIISGGENIYSVQVEEAIAKNDAVLEVAVVGIPDDEWGESVKAFVVLKPGRDVDETEIIQTAKENLASYQKPRIVQFVNELPKAPTGKILKRELRKKTE
ncbi:MAG: AMP-dependent synthetase [Acidimicrobiaceae bacterium]|nr:AMP-dependent synthetase [Acidimicrobiaceae bacterium]